MNDLSPKSLPALKRRLVAVLLAAVAGLIALVVWYHLRHRAVLRDDTEELLRYTLNVKISQLAEWRENHIADALSLLESPLFPIYLPRAAAEPPDRAAAELLRRRLESYMRHKRYSFAAITDSCGRALIYAGKKPEASCRRFAPLTAAAAAAGRPQLSGFSLHPGEGATHMDVAGALDRTPGKELFLLLRVRPADSLYPLLQLWVARGETGEILLAARDGDDVLFLNTLRHAHNAALRLRRPLSDENLPAALALRGFSGAVRGRDYRGIEVLAAVAPVPGTDWVMVAKQDWAEVMRGSDRVGLLLALLIASLLAAGGAVVYSTVMGRDREYSRALKESRDRLSLFIEHAPAAIAMLDTGMRYLAASRRWLSDYGLDRRDITGLNYYEVFPELPGHWKEVHLRCLKGASEKREAEPFLRADGKTDWISWEIIPWKKHDGAIGGILLFSEIVTARKRMEEDLRRSQKIESLGLLAGGIAHDFNNILTGITANLSLLLSKTGRGGEEGEALNEALAAANTAKGLTRQLLAFAEGGNPVKKELDAGKTMCEAARLALRGTPCSLELDIAPDLWSIEADETQLSQVIVNLAANAAQAMPGGGRLTLSAVNAERGGAPFIEVVVADTGAGIPEKHLKAIFDPYFTTKRQGHGLGLAMSYSIVKGHGGDIRVESEQGRGSIFTLLLPATGRAPAAAAGRPRAPEGSGRVLVMDDEEVVLKACRRMLAALGYECELAGDGEEALAAYVAAAAAGRPFDAVIMDLTIQGGMGGKEAVAELRKKHPGARVIASSGYAAGTPVSEYAALGFDDLLAKPYNYEELAALLKKVIGGGR